LNFLSVFDYHSAGQETVRRFIKRPPSHCTSCRGSAYLYTPFPSAPF